MFRANISHCYSKTGKLSPIFLEISVLYGERVKTNARREAILKRKPGKKRDMCLPFLALPSAPEKLEHPPAFLVTLHECPVIRLYNLNFVRLLF
jgi:hypothetical protein